MWSTIQEIRNNFEDESQRWQVTPRTEADIASAVGYWKFYPSLVWMIHNAPDASDMNIPPARRTLNRAHHNATKFLMELGESIGIDTGALWEGALLCEDLVSNEHLGPAATWPACVRPSMAQLDAATQRVVLDSERTFMRLMAKLNAQENNAEEFLRSIHSPKENSDRIRWDRDARTLYLDGAEIRKYKLAAANQFPILDSFQELGWPKTIDDPIPPKTKVDPVKRVNSTVTALNEGITGGLKFSSANAGKGFSWSIGKKKRPKI